MAFDLARSKNVGEGEETDYTIVYCVNTQDFHGLIGVSMSAEKIKWLI